MVVTGFLLAFVLLECCFFMSEVYCSRRENEFASTPIKCDAPAQTQNPGAGKDTAEIFP